MLDPSTVAVGDVLPPMERRPDLGHWNRFAAVNDEFVPIHMDDEAGRAAGYPSAFGMGNLQWSYLHNLLRDWLDDSGRIVSVSCQFRAANTRGQVVTARGVVTAVRDEHGDRLVEVEVWTEDDSGRRLAPGRAVVALPLPSA